MNHDDLTTADVLADNTKNFCSIYQSTPRNEDDDDIDMVILSDNEYYTDTEFIELIKRNGLVESNHLSILSINIANLLSKLTSLKNFLSYVSTYARKPDIVCLVETHISESTNSGYTDTTLTSIIPGYHFFHKGRCVKKGGGVGILVSEDLLGKAVLHEFSQGKVPFIEEEFENIVVRVPECIENSDTALKRDLVIAALYRQPNNNNLENFLKHTENLLLAIDKPKYEIVIAGDMNLDLLKYESHLPTSRYLDMMTNHQLIPRIVRPTRIKNRSATLIDHIFTRSNGSAVNSGILDTELAGNCGFTDHKPIFTFLRSKVPRKDKFSKITLSYFTNEGHRKRRQGLLNECWIDTMSESDPNRIYDNLIQKYDKHYKSNLTTKQISRGSNRIRQEPWMTEEILTDIRKRDRLAKIKERNKEYKALRNSIVSRCRKAEKAHLAKQVEESVGDIKRHWKILKKVINKTNNKQDISTKFFQNGDWIENDQDNADNFNHFFAKIGVETNESVGIANFAPEHYLHRHRQRNEHALLLCDFNEDEVKLACLSLSRKKSQDPSGFKQDVVLHDAELFIPVLLHLVNSSFREGICPNNSKIARVIPVYKQKGNKYLYDNYRPVALLPVFSKIMERLIYNRVFDFLVRYEIIFESQFGFRSGHNTTHATLDFVKNIEEALDKNEIAIGVFCDLSKAFDTLDHNVLLMKLDHYGIRGKLNDWFSSYLSGRQQFVDWNGACSSKRPILTGVPQGSILGPLLFLIYINDLPSASNLKCTLYADDSNLLIRGKDIHLTAQALTTQLERISDYFKSNKLKLNAKKTKLVCFRKPSRLINYSEIEIFFDGQKLQFEEEAVFLGITLDCYLKWDSHCRKVANKISANNGILQRVKKLLPAHALKTLYCSLILPHLQYGLAAWGGCSGQAKKRISLIQKRAIRTICKAYYTSHTEPRMRKLGLMKLDDLYKLQCSTFIHDVINQRAPTSLSSMLAVERDSTSHQLRHHLSDPNRLRVPIAKSKFSSMSFCHQGPVIWNQLPQELKVIERKSIFKSRLKAHILTHYDETTQCRNPRCTDKKHHAHPFSEN